jgi:hypothetical protein
MRQIGPGGENIRFIEAAPGTYRIFANAHNTPEHTSLLPPDEHRRAFWLVNHELSVYAIVWSKVQVQMARRPAQHNLNHVSKHSTRSERRRGKTYDVGLSS